VNGGADDERNEADGVCVVMSPEATRRAVVGRLARGKVLKTDARTRSTIGVVIGSTRAGRGESWSAEGADGADGGGAKRCAGGSCRGMGGVTDTGRGGKRKPVTGGARTGDADMGGGAEGERSEAYGMSGAMPPVAASRVCVRTLSAGTGLKTDARAMPGCWLTKAEGAVATGSARH